MNPERADGLAHSSSVAGQWSACGPRRRPLRRLHPLSPGAASASQPPQPARAAGSRGTSRSGNVPLPGASVVVQVGDAVKAATSTDADGKFTIVFSPNATYHISAELTAFARAERDLTLAAPPCDTTVDFVSVSEAEARSDRATAGAGAPGGPGARRRPSRQSQRQARRNSRRRAPATSGRLRRRLASGPEADVVGGGAGAAAGGRGGAAVSNADRREPMPTARRRSKPRPLTTAATSRDCCRRAFPRTPRRPTPSPSTAAAMRRTSIADR